MSEAGAPSDSELPGQGGALLIGQLLHVQGHGARLIAKLVVLRDIHVTFRVPCVIGHPDRDRGTCDGHLRTTVDGQGRERDREEERHMHMGQVSGALLQLAVPGPPPEDLRSGHAHGTGAGREGPSDRVSPVACVLSREGELNGHV